MMIADDSESERAKRRNETRLSRSAINFVTVVVPRAQRRREEVGGGEKKKMMKGKARKTTRYDAFETEAEEDFL